MKQGTPRPKEVIDFYQQVHDDKSLTWCQKVEKVRDYEHKNNPNYIGPGGEYLSIGSDKDLPDEKVAYGLFKLWFCVVKGNYSEMEEKDLEKL